MPLTRVNQEWSEGQELASLQANIVNFKGEASYTAGGTQNVANSLGYAKGKLLALIPISHGGYTWDYDSGSDRLKVYSTANTEVASLTNLGGIIFRALVIAEQ